MYWEISSGEDSDDGINQTSARTEPFQAPKSNKFYSSVNVTLIWGVLYYRESRDQRKYTFWAKF